MPHAGTLEASEGPQMLSLRIYEVLGARSQSSDNASHRSKTVRAAADPPTWKKQSGGWIIIGRSNGFAEIPSKPIYQDG